MYGVQDQPPPGFFLRGFFRQSLIKWDLQPWNTIIKSWKYVVFNTTPSK